GAQAALEAGGRRADTGTGGAEGKVNRRGGEGAGAELTIWMGIPVLVAAAGKVEENGGGDDRDDQVGIGEAAAHGAQAVADAGGGIEAIGRAAGEDERVDAVD